jgi:hypothetical protein
MSQAGTNVRLTVDLTRYHPSLKVGVEGVTIGAYGKWSRMYDRFTGVRFPQTTLDVAWSSLEVVRAQSMEEQAWTA